MGLEICPKCGSRGVYHESIPGDHYNTCISCGFLHIPGAVRQSFERQVTGKTERYGKGNHAGIGIKGHQDGFSEGKGEEETIYKVIPPKKGDRQ